jgi:hypothetical protein
MPRGQLTNPHNCCAPCSRQATANALLLPPTPHSWAKLSCSLSNLSPHPVFRSNPSGLAVSVWTSSSKTSRSTFRRTRAAKAVCSAPYIFHRTRFACSFLPARTSHRGVSGIQNSMQNCMAAGSAPSPTIHLHPCKRVEKTQPMTYATTCPTVMNNVDITTSLPRKGLGESSDMYNGTTKDALPTAKPTMERPMIIPQTPVVQACHEAPSIKRTSAPRTTVLRPRESARMPESGEASRAKREVQDVIRDLSSVVSGREERSEPMETSVEDITPVLRNNCQNALYSCCLY